MNASLGLLLVIFIYFGILFWIADYANKRRRVGKSFINNANIYSLSLAVYCTGWTFYGSVGLAAHKGLLFLPIYLGPTLMALLWGTILRKMIRVCKSYSLTSLADFISFRYGQDPIIGGLVAIIAVTGILPYISLQLKAVSSSFQLLASPEMPLPSTSIALADTTLYITILLTVFAIVFGVRKLDPNERHEGLVAAVTFESIIKLLAFLLIGVFVVYGLYDGVSDLFQTAMANEELQHLGVLGSANGGYAEWIARTLLAMFAILLLPRQFQMAVVENTNESHVNRAIWLFPLYLLLTNLFVLPIAIAGRLQFPEASVIDADLFVLRLPLENGSSFLAFLVFIGGLSAATGMIIVESVALSHMICNTLVMPILVKIKFIKIGENSILNKDLLAVRRGSVVVVLLSSYIHFRFVADAYPLVSTGLISFTAIAQLAPALIGGLYWKNGTRLGAIVGLIVGFSIWGYTLPFAQLINIGVFPSSILTEGLGGIGWLKPNSLFGLDHMSPLAQATFWSLFFNTACYVGISLLTHQNVLEHRQASLFVDVFRYSRSGTYSKLWRGTATMEELKSLLQRFLGKERMQQTLAAYAAKHQLDMEKHWEADAGLVQYTEKLLTGAIGSVAARIVVSSVVKEESLRIEEIMDILDETHQVITYSQRLEEQSQQLRQTTEELKQANLQLQELDTLKDDFISTITHELRTPLTSIRSFSEMLYDMPQLEEAKRQQFLSFVVKEAERLTRIINQVLDFEKMASGQLEWHMNECHLHEIINTAIASTSQLATDKAIQVEIQLSTSSIKILGDYDRLTQVMVNLLSNAIKFCPEPGGEITIQTKLLESQAIVRVEDNGIGIAPADQERVFERFHQVTDKAKGNPQGSGLGLTITKNIVERHQGTIRVVPHSGSGAIFEITLPLG